MTEPTVNYVHVVDADLEWLRDYVKMVDETIRQTRATPGPHTHAIKALTESRDRAQRIADRLAPKISVTFSGGGPEKTLREVFATPQSSPR